MNFDLIKTRIVAFLYEAGVMIALSILGYLASQDFANLVTQNFGESIVGSLILLGVSGIVKHLRNLSVLKKYDTLGAANGERKPPVLI